MDQFSHKQLNEAPRQYLRVPGSINKHLDEVVH